MFKLGDVAVDFEQMRTEMYAMRDVLMGRRTPPINVGAATLMEVANAYYGRALEMESTLLRAEADGHVLRNSSAYRFRTGELRKFTELAKAATELGSRRITALQTEVMMRGSA